MIELEKWGLDRRDLVANVNFFSRVTADEAGNMQFHSGNSRPGSHVDLRDYQIANAVSNAAGVRMTHIPMSPPRILAAIGAEKAG